VSAATAMAPAESALSTLARTAGGSLERAARALDAALAGGRLGHAYLLAGPTGAGKRSLARALAADLLGHVRRDASHPDLTVLAPEEGKREIGIEAVRGACAEFTLAPLEARGRVMIVHGADLLGEEAANALLKTLEEPPDEARILLTTARPDAVLPTIRSRCMIVRLAAAAAPVAGSTTAAPSESPLAALARQGAVLLDATLEPFERARRAMEVAAKAASEGEDDERPALEKKRRAALALIDGTSALLAARFRARALGGLPFDAEEVGLSLVATAARRIESNAVTELVLEVLALDLEAAGAAAPGAEPTPEPPHG